MIVTLGLAPPSMLSISLTEASSQKEIKQNRSKSHIYFLLKKNNNNNAENASHFPSNSESPLL